MGREKKKKGLSKAKAGGAKERHRRTQKSQYDPRAPMPIGFVAKPAIPKSKSKHHTYFEFVENKDKKKKLEFQITTKSTPPPGFDFVPIGNPALTTACKEISRERDAMIFIVSSTKSNEANILSQQNNRTGHHIRQAIVEEARATLKQQPGAFVNGQPEPLPATQEEYHAQANSMILELFPRIPNTDRQSILLHAFNMSAVNARKQPVGLSTDVPLSRRVQLAVLAHIRHTHTRYDDLLKETSWQNARKVVEDLCLDILVKWRGDEETGRDQLDEILREVVIISDSDSEDSEDESDDTEDSSIEGTGGVRLTQPEEAEIPPSRDLPQGQLHPNHPVPQPASHDVPGFMRTRQEPGQTPSDRAAARKAQRGFRRYHDAWQQAVLRNRGDESQPVAPAMTPSASHSSHRYYESPAPGLRQAAIITNAGTVPEPNGFVPRQPSTGPPPPLPLPNYNPNPPQYEQVTPNYRDQTRKTPSRSRNVSPVADRFQDMLVRSIEPASPQNTMPPSFVRAVPPRPLVSPARRPVPFRPESSSPTHEVGSREKPFYVDRRVVSDHPPPGPVSFRYHGEPQGLQPAPRIYDSRPSFHSPLSVVENRAHPPAAAPVPAQRITVGIGQPGDRSNPILMEDRGGFFERVHEEPRGPYSRPPEDIAGPSLRQPQYSMRFGEPHRVVSWEEGSRIPRESRDIGKIEAYPAPPPPPLLPTGPSYSTHMDANVAPRAYDSRSHQAHHDQYYPRGQAPQPIPRPQYTAQPPPPPGQFAPQGYHQHQGAMYHQQPPPQQPYDQHRRADQPARPDYGRPPPGGDVIVIE